MFQHLVELAGFQLRAKICKLTQKVTILGSLNGIPLMVIFVDCGLTLYLICVTYSAPALDVVTTDGKFNKIEDLVPRFFDSKSFLSTLVKLIGDENLARISLTMTSFAPVLLFVAYH